MLRLQDWRKVLREATGEDISTRAMMDYFKPLMSWLEEQKYRGLLLRRGAFQRLAQGPCSDELSLWKLPASRWSSGSSLDHGKAFSVPIRERNATPISDGDRSVENVLRSLRNVSDL